MIIIIYKPKDYILALGTHTQKKNLSAYKSTTHKESAVE
jgi:hypothetical protein